MACFNKSAYLVSLESENKDFAIRYKDKIRVIQGIDPYTLEDSPVQEQEEIANFPPVDAFHIVSYLVLTHSFYTNQQMKAYKSLSAYKYFEAGFVQNCRAQKIGDHIVVLGQVKHSQRMNESSLKVWVICQSDGSIITAHCTCMAGLSEVCSHVGAILYGLEYMYQTARNLSPTDVKAKWIVPSISNVPVTKLKEMVFRKTLHEADSSSSNVVPALEGVELVNFLQEIKDNDDDAALMRVVEPFASEMAQNIQVKLPKCYDLYKREYESLSYKDLCALALQINEQIDIELSKKILMATMKQNKANEWFEQRTGRITASNFKRVCKTSVTNPSLSLIKSICYPMNVQFKSKATDWGLVHEKTALEEFKEFIKEKHINFKIEETGLHVVPDYPFLGASPDAMVLCDCCDSVCVEVKCPYVLKNMNFKDYIESKNSCLMYDPRDKNKVVMRPDHLYFYQIQMQMQITKCKFGYFVIWSPKDFYVMKIPANKDFWDYNLPKAYEFHKKVILPELLGRYFTKGKHLQSWCYCNTRDDGRPMIKCDNEDCEIQWFHLECTALTDVPQNIWVCHQCV